MNKTDNAGLESRRRFLKSMALTGGGVAVTATTGQALAADGKVEGTREGDEPKGYRETQHIRDYYAKAQF